MQDKWGLFQKFLIAENAQVSVTDFLINAVIVIVLSFILERTYTKCAKSLSNRKMFSYNFMLVAFTTMLIISIVKSSLALSLGLVGALSIVRFRAAIKEPEELAYLFFTISIGLGLGANQRLIVVVAFVIILAMVWIRYFFSSKKKKGQNLYLTVSSHSPGSLQLNKIENIVGQNFKNYELQRFDENENLIEASFLIESKNTQQIQECKNGLQSFDKAVRVSYIENKL